MARYLSFKGFPSEERILQIAIALEVAPTEIFPEEISDLRLLKQPEAIPVSLEQATALGFGGLADEMPALDSDESLDTLSGLFTEVLKTLTAREARVIELRYGFDEGAAGTLKEVAREFGVTRERIRQIEAKALRKLRHPTRRRRLMNPDYKTCMHADGCRAREDLTEFNGSVLCPRAPG